jgi:hypothetical protein
MRLEVTAVPALIYGLEVLVMKVEQGKVTVCAAGTGGLTPMAGYTLKDQEYEQKRRSELNLTQSYCNRHIEH